MKLWIDDLRPSPGNKWNEARTSAEAISILQRWRDASARLHGVAPIWEISFDHDLGGEDTTRPVMLWMVENNVWPKRIFVHTANPVGRDWLVGVAKQYAPEGVEIAA
jgi:hypothetical protein